MKKQEAMNEFVTRESVYEFAKDQLIKETGAYSKGSNNANKIMMGAAHNRDALKSVEVRPVVHGEWMPSDEFKGYLVCSACRDCYIEPDWVIYGNLKWNWCPNCGADMRVRDDG